MLKTGYYAAGAAWATATRRHPVGRSIYDAEWDICIILDSARADLFAEVAPGYLPSAARDTAWSRGSITTEWLAQTFRPPHEDKIAETTLLSATPHTTTVFDERHWLTNQRDVGVPYPALSTVERDAFAAVHELWRTHAGEHGAVPPETMLDATVAAHRDTAGPVIAHWLQPHEPFIAPGAEFVGGAATESNVWDGLQAGEYDPDMVWDSYRRNLIYALEAVATLCEVVDATVLVTADHGNAFGEWGVYGHPFGWLQPAVRRVPWWTVQASATRSYKPVDVLDTSLTMADREAQLEALGYR